MIAWVKSFALSIAAVAWVLGVPIVVGLATTPDLGFLAFVGTGGIVFLAGVLHDFVFDL